VVKEEKELPDAIRNKLKKEWNKQDGIFKKWQEANQQAAAASSNAEESKTE